MRVSVIEGITLDGVAQAPARPDEDRRGGFEHGGWAIPYQDEVVAQAMAKRMAQGRDGNGALLLGRRTYEDFFQVWPNRGDNPFTEHLNRVKKYVASRTLKEPLPWSNSTLLQGDAVEAVARLKEQGGPDLAVLGSLELVQALARRNLVDEYLLTISPLILGTGRRLFGGDAHAALELVDATTTSKGVIIATYRPASA